MDTQAFHLTFRNAWEIKLINSFIPHSFSAIPVGEGQEGVSL